ncbi:HNH endonuclease [Amycolatopsis sp. H6(2020)]|nr:HNH endonuclease [Amycolatopsis sp. H6(2020)]
MLVHRVDITRRVERYGRVLDWMENDRDLYSDESPLQLSAVEQALTLGKLDAEIYVLPQNSADGSEWTTAFTARERAYWVHRLANLVLLSRRKNSAAGNLEFEAKKTKYFEKTSWAPFVLTSQVLASDAWTPAVLEERQEILLKVLGDLWRLDPAAS